MSFFLVPVSSEFFLPLMRRDLLAFSFFSAGHVGTPYTESPLSMHKNKKAVKGATIPPSPPENREQWRKNARYRQPEAG